MSLSNSLHHELAMDIDQDSNFGSASVDLTAGLLAAAGQDCMRLILALKEGMLAVWEEIVISVSWWTYRMTER
jgi:hypothetical protein